MTRQEREAKANIERWQQSVDYSLDDAYGSYSANKSRAWRHCESVRADHNGSNLKVVSHNTFMFTAGFQLVDQESGVVKYMHITPTYETAVDM